MTAHSPFMESDSVKEISKKVLRGKRIDRAEAMILYKDASLHTLAYLANHIRFAKHPERIVTYVADRNINYSNICCCACRFCAFFVAPEKAETNGGYVISREELGKKIEETIALGGTQILMQGGHHPDLTMEFYEDMIRWIKTEYPSIHIHAFSPPEIAFFAENEQLLVKDVIARLRAAGLDSIPGGGAEILVDEVRKQVSPNKCSATRWLAIMEEAHYQGLNTTATMMFGHEEKLEHRIEHLFAVRDVQDRTNGFTAFIPWTFQPGNTNITCRPEPSSGYLRVLAMARIVLDNIDNVQASWVTMGPEIAQLALSYGANDFGSLMIEENVVAAAGVSFRLTREEIHSIVEAAGFMPKQRTMDYQLIEQKEA
ncbi:MAG: dehypoxanthine futalosine cyclase [Desulfovibrionales bacterium]|nr:dehypoxanthine futalosine cyclase [Desulfovibrionales bacterium]